MTIPMNIPNSKYFFYAKSYSTNQSNMTRQTMWNFTEYSRKWKFIIHYSFIYVLKLSNLNYLILVRLTLILLGLILGLIIGHARKILSESRAPILRYPNRPIRTDRLTIFTNTSDLRIQSNTVCDFRVFFLLS